MIKYDLKYKLRSKSVLKFDISTKFLHFLLCITLLAYCNSLYAQYDKSAFKKLNIEIEGEEVYDASSITQDNYGYIWMGTNLGLIRYDGIEGKKYDFDSFSNDDNRIEVLYTDSQGDIWVGAPSGLSKYNHDCDCLNKIPSKDFNNLKPYIRSIAEDKNQNIWIATSNIGLYQFNRKNGKFSKFIFDRSNPIRLEDGEISTIIVDSKNNLWIGTFSINSINPSGLLRFNIDTEKVKRFLNESTNQNSLLDNRISALFEDQHGQLLIGTYKTGLHIYNPKNEAIIRQKTQEINAQNIHAPLSINLFYGDDPYVQLIHHDHNGGYWIGTSGKGINYFNTKTKTLKNYNFDLVNPQLIGSIYEDRQGSIWIGCVHGGGLYRMNLFGLIPGLNNNFSNVEAAYESQYNPGILWIKSLQDGLSKMDLKSGFITKYLQNKENQNSIGHNWVRSSYQENKNSLWLGIGYGGVSGVGSGDGGVDLLDIKRGVFKHFTLTRKDDTRQNFSYTGYSICEDLEKRLWIGAGEGGIFRSNKEKSEFQHYKITNEDNKPGDVIVNRVIVDSIGRIWATDFKGTGTLYLYNRVVDRFEKYINGFKTVNLLIDDKGWILISTWEKGLIHLNPSDRSYIQYTKNDGLPSNDALDIVEGDFGKFWVNTRQGPALFDPLNGKISAVGLPKVRYNTGIFKASDGKIYVGLNNGIGSFHPSQVGGNPNPPQVVISDLLISEKNYISQKNKSNKLIFRHSENDISFKYVGLHFSSTEKNIYQYKLSPLHENWINVGTERTARFFNLNPGSYSFQLKAANSDGVWTKDSTTIQFTIKSPWWTTWWAYMAYIALFSLLASKIYSFQLSRKMAQSESKRLKEVHEFKNNLFTNITHEFRTPLTVIKGMSESIKSNVQAKKYNDVESSLEMIDRNSDGLLHLINEMLDLAKLEGGKMELQMLQADVVPFLKYVSESFSSYAEENKISLTVYSEIDSLIMDFDASKLTSIISNLLSNAIKFTSAQGKIIVHINQVDLNKKPFLIIKIKDDGIGISEDTRVHIFDRFYQSDASSVRQGEGTGIGLALTKELVDLMCGNIQVQSILNYGSEFCVTLPITNHAVKAEPSQFTNVPHSKITNSDPLQTTQLFDIDLNLPLVLIIEDNFDVAHYLKTCLHGKYETIHAANGIEGIDIALEKIPDIIISDVMMPGKDGFEVCEVLKSDERTDHIPIIILTAKVTFEDRLKGLARGADAYLAKPFRKEELFVRLNQLVTSRIKLIQKLQKEGSLNLIQKRTKNPKLIFLQKITQLVHDEISDSSFGSEALSKKLFISESQIYRKVKAITGKSTAIYIRTIRLQYAKSLLMSTNKTVSEVAYEAGFNDPSWFSRCFKDEFGISPSSTTK